MTYGVYTKDLKGCYLEEASLESALKVARRNKRECFVCEETDKCYGFSIAVTFDKDWDFCIKPRLKYLIIGPVMISWCKMTCKGKPKILNIDENK